MSSRMAFCVTLVARVLWAIKSFWDNFEPLNVTLTLAFQGDDSRCGMEGGSMSWRSEIQMQKKMGRSWIKAVVEETGQRGIMYENGRICVINGTFQTFSRASQGEGTTDLGVEGPIWTTSSLRCTEEKLTHLYISSFFFLVLVPADLQNLF